MLIRYSPWRREVAAGLSGFLLVVMSRVGLVALRRAEQRRGRW